MTHQVKAPTDIRFVLHFAESEGPVALWKTEFSHPYFAPSGRCTVRGKDKGAYEASGAFQWSPAVKVLASYLLRCAASPNQHLCPALEGGPGSPAATLDYAITKQNKWICDMFGSDPEGRPNLIRLLLRSNSGLKRRGEPVVLRLKPDKLPPRHIQALMGLLGHPVEKAEEMERLAATIEHSWKPKQTEQSGAVLTLSGSAARDWTPEKQQAFEQVLARLGIKGCTIVSVKEGSIKLTLKLPPDEAERLFWAFHSGDLTELDALSFAYADLEDNRSLWGECGVGQPQGSYSPPTRHVVIGSVGLDNFIADRELLTIGAKARLNRFCAVGGGGANVAIGLKRLLPKAEVILLAGTGDDTDGQVARDLLAVRGVVLPRVVVPGQATRVSFIFREQQSNRSTVITDGGASIEPVPINLVEERLSDCAACWIVSVTPRQLIQPIVSLAAQRNVPVVFRLGASQIGQLGYQGLRDQLTGPLAILMCNRDDALRLTNQTSVPDQLQALTFEERVRTVVIADGGDGLYALHDGRVVHMPAYCDGRAIGSAPEAVNAAMTVIGRWLLSGRTVEDALLAGVRQWCEATVTVGADSGGLSEEELLDFINNRAFTE